MSSKLYRKIVIEDARTRRRLFGAALLPALLIGAFAGMISASAQTVYDQVFGGGSPGFGNYNPRTRSYRREESANRAAPRSFRSGAFAVGRIGGGPVAGKRGAGAEKTVRTAAKSGRDVSLRLQSPKPATRLKFASAAIEADPEREWPRSFNPNGKGSYRTMCVRECDGYYYPVSFSTRKRSFAEDAEACSASCGSPVSLYYYPNPGGEPEDMISYETGVPYAAMKNAFLYRTKFVADCRCQPEPWTQEARERHRKYAAADADPKVELVRADAEEAERRKSWRESRYRRSARSVHRERYVRRVARAGRSDARPARRSFYLRQAGTVRRWSF